MENPRNRLAYFVNNQILSSEASRAIFSGKSGEYIPIRIIDIAGQMYVEGIKVSEDPFLRSVKLPLFEAQLNKLVRLRKKNTQLNLPLDRSCL